MKQFYVFIKKEFHHIFRDTWTMIILLVLPILMLVLFGYALTTDVKNSSVVIFDPSKDEATKRIISLLEVSEYFSVVGTLESNDQIEEVFRRGSASLVLVFSENFYENMLHTGEAAIQMITDGTDPNTAVTITNYATNIISAYQQEISGILKIPYEIKITPRFLYNPEMRSSYTFVPGVMGMIIMLVCAMMTSISIAREKETGTMEILLVSPMKPLFIILSKVVPYFFLSCVNLATILLLAVYLLHVPIVGNLFTLIVISLLYIFVSLAIGLLISSIAKSQIVALLISGMALMMPVMYLSGMMFPIENMPVGLQFAAQILPAKWYIVAVKKVMIKGLGFSSIIKELFVLGGMAVFLITLSLKKFKIRLE
ncbi:MAG: ABC transporter permease [Spirochaetaceae bacterium]|jgi:ABC-2 type transport system permease protein|nr:ABC transporter permease [Spirochaetaceae bacterium]